MGYMHINNLYKDQKILLFKECYALEKLHGTSTFIKWKDQNISFFSGGCKHEQFVSIFNEAELIEKFKELGHDEVVIFGEGYGGKMQAMKHTYGEHLKFCAFDVKVGDYWLTVPDAEDVVKKLGLEFVHYTKISTDLESLDRARDAFSVQAIRNGCGDDKIMEGVVLRPLMEFRHHGDRVMVKHKRDEFRETKTPRPVVDPEKLAVLEKADSIANEWVTDERLRHVLDKLPPESYEKNYGVIIKAMVEDIYREGAGEIVESKEANKAIGKRTMELYNKFLRSRIEA